MGRCRHRGAQVGVYACGPEVNRGVHLQEPCTFFSGHRVSH